MKMQFQSIALAGTLFFSPATFAQGALNLIGNGSFELVNNNTNVDLVISPWRWSYSLILFIGSPTDAADGTNSAQVSGLIYQDVTVHPGSSYQLTFAFGGNDWNQVNRGPLTVTWGMQTVTVIPVEPSQPTWRYMTFDLTATSDLMRLSFSTLGAQAYPRLDDVSLIAIPEPATVRLFFAGLIALGTRRALKQSNSRRCRESTTS